MLLGLFGSNPFFLSEIIGGESHGSLQLTTIIFALAWRTGKRSQQIMQAKEQG